MKAVLKRLRCPVGKEVQLPTLITEVAVLDLESGLL